MTDFLLHMSFSDQLTMTPRTCQNIVANLVQIKTCFFVFALLCGFAFKFPFTYDNHSSAGKLCKSWNLEDFEK